MIIECINCNKKFAVNSELIPSFGRTIQCGSCNHTWFFKHKNKTLNYKKKQSLISPLVKEKKDQTKSSKINEIDINLNNGKFELTKYKKKSNLSISKFFSYLLVLLISFVGVIVLIDTFDAILYEKFPKLEILIFSLFEILKDVQLFIKDLI